MTNAPRERETVVRLSATDRQLILEHGYPAGELRQELTRLAKTRRDRLVSITHIDLGTLIGDLSFATNRASERVLAEELNDLCERLEREERQARS